MNRKPPCFTILLVLLLLLSGCGEAADTRTLPELSEEPDKTAPAFRVDIETRSGDARTEDGQILASYIYDLPVMRVLRRDGTILSAGDARTVEEAEALGRAETFNREFETWASEADFPALEEAARQDYNWGAENVCYQQALQCTVYQTERLVSVSGTFYYYGGGAHPNRVYLGWNYDAERGAFLSAGQLFDDAGAVAAELVRQAESWARENGSEPEDFYWPDYASIVEEWSESTAAVTFDGQSMTVCFSPYDLASYAAGEQVFTIPLSQVRPYLSERGRYLTT